MIRTTKLSLLSLGLVAALATGAARAQEPDAHAAPKPERQAWTFAGPFGTYDRAQLQRGFQVYREVCANCHSMQSVSIRNVGEPGGPEFSEAQVKALAADYKVKDGPNDAGEMFERPGRPSDRFPSPYPNPEAARATLGAIPPDFSVLAKARSYSRGFPLFLIDALPIPGGAYQEHGVDYIYALLNGYSKNDDPNYNDYFPGHKIGMAKPLSDGQVEYTDGSPKTVQQYARDVASFMMWAAEPKLEERKRTGFRVMAFLLIFGGLMYYTKKKVWSAVAH
jgi:ubiquinol-cytochrome c reductase cytochrome c1 subunit